MTIASMSPISWKFTGKPWDLNSLPLSPDQVWAMLDLPPEEVRASLNVLIGALNSVVDGSSGASNIAMTPIASIGTQADVQSVVEAIITRLQAVTAGLSGAKFIGVETIAGLTGNDVQTLISALKTYVDTHKTSLDHDGQYYNKTASDAKYETITDLTVTRKLSATGDFTGTWAGLVPTASDPGLAASFNAHLAETVTEIANIKTGYGATGDGVADDTQARTDAIADLGADGGVMYFPKGEYNMTPLSTAELPQTGVWEWIISGLAQYLFESGAVSHKSLHHYPDETIATNKTIRDTSIRAVVDGDGRFHAFHFDLEAGAGATNIDACRGLIGQIRTAGASSAKTIHGTAVGLTGHSSTLMGVVGEVEPAPTTTEAYSFQATVGDNHSNAVPNGAMVINPTTVGDHMRWVIRVDNNCAVDEVIFLADHGGEADFLKLRDGTATDTRFKVDKYGRVYSTGDASEGIAGVVNAGGDTNGTELRQGGVYRTNAAGGLIIAAGADAGTILFLQAGNSNQFEVSNNGMSAIGATGGKQGSGTINAKAVYDDGVILTCYVMQAWVDGKIDLPFWNSLVLDEPITEPEYNESGEIIGTKQVGTIERNHEPARKFSESGTWQLDINEWEEWIKENKRLPAFPGPDQWQQYFNGKMATGDLIQRLWETVEVQAVHISTLNDRLEIVEDRISTLGV